MIVLPRIKNSREGACFLRSIFSGGPPKASFPPNKGIPLLFVFGAKKRAFFHTSDFLSKIDKAAAGEPFISLPLFHALRQQNCQMLKNYTKHRGLCARVSLCLCVCVLKVAKGESPAAAGAKSKALAIGCTPSSPRSFRRRCHFYFVF